MRGKKKEKLVYINMFVYMSGNLRVALPSTLYSFQNF